jgi:hypothetical protein
VFLVCLQKFCKCHCTWWYHNGEKLLLFWLYWWRNWVSESPSTPLWPRGTDPRSTHLLQNLPFYPWYTKFIHVKRTGNRAEWRKGCSLSPPAKEENLELPEIPSWESTCRGSCHPRLQGESFPSFPCLAPEVFISLNTTFWVEAMSGLWHSQPPYAT